MFRRCLPNPAGEIDSKVIADAPRHSRANISWCGQTAAETVVSSNSILASGVRHGSERRLPSLQECLLCFWPTREEQPRQNCFVTIDCSAEMLDRSEWLETFVESDTPVFRSDSPSLANGSPVENDGENHEPWIPPLPQLWLAKVSGQNNNELVCPTSRVSFAECTKNGTLNTQHRRTDISLGFFTSETLDAIVKSSPAKAKCAIGTPYDGDGQSITDGKCLPAFGTPAHLARIDSEAFVVTCEKGKMYVTIFKQISQLICTFTNVPLSKVR